MKKLTPPRLLLCYGSPILFAERLAHWLLAWTPASVAFVNYQLSTFNRSSYNSPTIYNVHQILQLHMSHVFGISKVVR